MVIAVIGIGGVGGYFGGKLAKEKSDDCHIYFVARGEHGEKIKKDGLTLITSSEGQMICHPTAVLEQIDDLPLLDVCFLCVKQYDLVNCLMQLKSKIKENTIIIPLLNGVDIYERIREVITNGYVYPTCVYVGTHIEEPGVVIQNGGACEIVFGKDKIFDGNMPEQLCKIMDDASIRFRWSDNYLNEIWEKYIFIASYGLMTAGEGKTLGEIYEDSDLRNRTEEIMKEIISLGQAERISFSEDILQRSIEKAKNFPYNAKTSFQRDFETVGKKDERELFGQTLFRLGEKHGIKIQNIEDAYEKLINEGLKSQLESVERYMTN